MQEPGDPQPGDGAISQRGIIERVVSWFSSNKAQLRDATVDTLRFGAPVNVTISSNAITVTSSNHNITASGTLNTINAWDSSGMMVLLTADAAVTIAHGSDNILCWGDQNISLDVGDLAIIFRPDPTSTNYVAIGDTFSSSSHTRSHTITNASDHTANNWKMIHTSATGVVTEFAVGADGTVVTGTGVSSAPAFEGADEHRHSNEDGYNGSFIEPFTFVITSNGTVITGTLDANPTGDLTERFSDGRSTATSGITVTLTVGTDTAPKKNFIYILQSNKGVLVASDSDWPATEHIRVAEVIVQSAAKVQTDSGGLLNRFWNDHIKSENEQGHHIESWARMRFEHAKWRNGVAITWTIDTDASPDTVDLAVTAGKIFQMHLQDFEAKNTGTGDNVHVVNGATPYAEVSDFADLLTDNTGNPMSGKFFTLVVWGSVSSGDEIEHIFVNLPGGSYNKEGDAIADVSGYTVYDIPSDFRGAAFLITQITLKHTAGGGGQHTSKQQIDLRGQVPNIVAGGGTAAITTEFADSQFIVFDDGDPTREIAFQASSISGSTKRTITMPDEDVTLIDDATSDPLVDGDSASDGTEGSLARKDHVHPNVVAYLSLKNDEPSTAITGIFDVFDNTNYTGAISQTATVTAKNITYTEGDSDGKFTCDVAGIYHVTYTLNFSTDTIETGLMYIKDGGAIIWSLAFTGHTATDPQPHTVSIIRAMSAADYFNFECVTSTGNAQANAGTTVTIHKIAEFA